MSRSLLVQSDFGKEIRKRLIDLDLEAKDLAAMLGYSSSYIGEVLRGTRKAKHIRSQICEAVGLDYDELMKQLQKGA